MFFKNKPEPPKPEYSKELDTQRDTFEVFIDLKAFNGKILSVERLKINTPDEETVIFVLPENSQDTEEYPFLISRNQHKILIETIKSLKP